MSAGFAAVFTVAGLLLSAGLRVLIGIVPCAAVAVGVALVVLGVLLVTGRKVGLSVNVNGIAGRRTGPVGLVLFGAGYALASLSCTVAVLLAVVGQAWQRRTCSRFSRCSRRTRPARSASWCS